MMLEMTRGKPGRLLLLFALPLMFSSLLQQLYNLCDSLIVGRYLGALALTATGSAGNLHWFAQNFVGCAINAFGIALAQRYGARDREGFRSFFAGSFVLSAALGIFVTVLSFMAVGPFLALVGTPAELTDQAETYLRVLWMGFLVTAMMNLSSAALMSIGDSKTPLASLAISSLTNIALDVLFLAIFGMGVGGAALATVLAQVVAALWNLRSLLKKGGILPQVRHFRLKRAVMKELLRLSVPQMISSVVINSGDLLVQYVINSHGVLFVMGMNAARRYFNLLNVVGYGLEGSLVTYVGQNWGAGDMARIRRGTRFATGMGAVTSAVTGLAVFLLAEPMIRFLLTDAPEESIRFGIQAMRIQAMFLPGLYLLCEFRAAVQGMGNVTVPTMAGFSELLLRLAAVLLLPMAFGREGLYYTDAAAWVPTALMVMAFYLAMTKKDLPANTSA